MFSVMHNAMFSFIKCFNYKLKSDLSKLIVSTDDVLHLFESKLSHKDVGGRELNVTWQLAWEVLPWDHRNEQGK